MQLRAFASVLRARQVAFRTRRLVAFSRAKLFFSCSGTFGRVLGVILSSFLVISSSFFVAKWLFREWRATGGCGTGWAGRAAVCCAWLPRAGGRMGKMAWDSFEIGIQLRQGRGCARSSCSTSVLQERGVCSCWVSQGASRNGGAFLSCSEGQDSQQLSELWFRQSVCWRQLTAAAQAASSLTRIRRTAVRFWRQATCICHPLEQFLNRRGSRNRMRARGPRSQGHVPQKFGMHPRSLTPPWSGTQPNGSLLSHSLAIQSGCSPRRGRI